MSEGFGILIIMILIFVFTGDPDLWDTLTQQRDRYIETTYVQDNPNHTKQER